jgi:iron complex transport system ATP-binding protein
VILLEGGALCFSRNGQTILDGVDVTLAKGEMLGLIGPNGAGKSTLIKLVAGLLQPDRGELQLDGAPFEAASPGERARRIAYLPQLSRIAWPMQVERLVELGRIPHLEPWQRLGAGTGISSRRLYNRPTFRLSGIALSTPSPAANRPGCCWQGPW